MGEQSIQPEAGVLREAETDRGTNSLEPGSAGDKPKHDIILDIDGNPINDVWERASMDSIMMESLEEMSKMLRSVVLSYEIGRAHV